MVFKVDRIGIGVSNPSQNLDVNGGCKFTGPNIYLDWHNDQRVISSANNNYRQGYHFDANARLIDYFQLRARRVIPVALLFFRRASVRVRLIPITGQSVCV